MWLYVIAATILYCVLLRKVVWRNTYLGGIDATFASADAYGLRTTIHCVFTLDANVTAETFRDLLLTKYLVHRRLKQRLVHRTLLWHYWQDVSETELNLNHHFIVHEQLPGGNGQPQLEDYVSNQLTTPLHPDRPLWEFHLIRNFGPNKDQSVALYRVHHCVGDGIALMRIALTVFEAKTGIKTKPVYLDGDDTPKSSTAVSSASGEPLSPPTPLTPPLTATASPAPLSPQLRGKSAPAPDEKSVSASAAEGKNRKSVTHTGGGEKKPRVNYVKLGWGVLSSIVKLLVLPPDPVSPLKHGTNMDPFTNKIRVRWSRAPIPLAKLKQISAQTKTSINDILVSCGSGAIGTFLTDKKQKEAGSGGSSGGSAGIVNKAIQAVLWVSLRGLDLTVRKVDFSNRLGTVYLKLPLHITNVLDRLKHIQQQTARLIQSPEAYVSFGIMTVVGYLPPILTRWIWYVSAFKVTLSMSNLPGPSQPLTFAGGDVSRFIFFVPPVRTIGHFLCILSYNQSVVCGLACDERLVDDPIDLVNCFHAEVDRLAVIAADQSKA